MTAKLLWDIFILFSRVALFSWGGGPASMGLMQREAVSADWVTPQEFADALAVGNALPGPIAPQVSAFIGYKLAGLPGAISAVTGTILPTTFLMLIMIIFFFNIKDNPNVAAMIKAVRPVVIGLLIWTAISMTIAVFNVKNDGWGIALSHNWEGVLIATGSFLLLTFTTINPVWLVIIAAGLGFVIYR